MKVLFVVEELTPNESDLMNNFFDKRVNDYAKLGYEIEKVESLEDLKKGDEYVDINGFKKRVR